MCKEIYGYLHKIQFDYHLSHYQSIMAVITSEAIKKAIFAKYKPEETKGMFVSLFDEQKNLLASNGVLATDKPLDQLIDILENGIISKYPAAKTADIFIIQDVVSQTDVAKLMTVPPEKNGIFMIQKDGQKSGVMLP